MLFAAGIVGLILIGAVLCWLSIGWITLHFGESFQETYAKGVVWKFVADIVFGGATILLVLLAKWLVLTEGIEYDKAHYISTFTPLDEAELVETRDLFELDVVPIASSDADIIYLRPGASETDVVYITYRDGGDTWQLAPDLATFLRTLRAVPPDVQALSEDGGS